MKTLSKLAALGLLGGSLLAALPAQAHHSFAMFDMAREHQKTVIGTIKEFQWTNPHGVIWVYVPVAGKAQPEVWAVELTSVGNLRRAGWSKDSLKPGDKVKVILNPLRNGQTGGGFQLVTVLDTGKELRQGLTAPPKEAPLQ